MRLTPPDDSTVLSWCKAILEWGLGTRGQRAFEELRNKKSISEYLRQVQDTIRLDSVTLDEITSSLVGKVGSGVAKILSLLSTDGLIILDSRVGAALGECVNDYVIEEELDVRRPSEGGSACRDHPQPD